MYAFDHSCVKLNVIACIHRLISYLYLYVEITILMKDLIAKPESIVADGPMVARRHFKFRAVRIIGVFNQYIAKYRVARLRTSPIAIVKRLSGQFLHIFHPLDFLFVQTAALVQQMLLALCIKIPITQFFRRFKTTPQNVQRPL